MNKKIYIVNGAARAGKDTFAEILKKMVPTWKYSSVTRVKEIAKVCGWGGGKTEKDRRFLSDLKLLLSDYNDLPFNDLKEVVDVFMQPNIYNEVLLIDIREPAEIDRAKQEFGAKTILIKNDRVQPITSNMADANVFNYEYDYIIDNSGSLENFEQKIKEFAKSCILE